MNSPKPDRSTQQIASRRRFLGTLAAAAPAALAGALTQANAQPATPASSLASLALPRRKLGLNGPDVTILTFGGTMKALDVAYMNLAWERGIRSYDTADCYLGGRSERVFADWVRKYPERRKDMFLVSKDHPRNGLQEIMQQIDRRLEACGTDYLDLFFIHGIGPEEYGEGSLDWPRSDELRRVFDAVKASGKARLTGFSCHNRRLLDYLNAAAIGGFVDVIMLKYNVFFTPGDEFDTAVQACHDKGIGLIAMKEMRAAKDVPRMIPEFESLNLTAHQGVLHKCWSDPRIAAVCSAMDSADIVRENTDAAARFAGPLPQVAQTALRDAMQRSRVALCPGCPACAADEMTYAFEDVSRYVAYYEQDADTDARALYRALPPESRRYDPAALARLRDRCAYQVDYPEIARRAERYFSVV